ncbi:MAG: YihY/virulence factor BrkB family protein [Gemmatimonadetes bacterium]|nr:YihY/virulence factor BrkB family protein [Gemmatimonadota bacterium]
MQIPGFRGVRVRHVAKESVRCFLEDDMATYAAALAYQVLFALFPFIIFLIALLSFLQIPGFFNWLMEQAQSMLPQDAMAQVSEVIGEIQNQREGGLLSFGIILAIWIASSGVRSTMNALNNAYNVKEARSMWKRFLMSIAYTLGLAVMLIIAVGLMLTGPQVMTWLTEQIGLDQVFVTLWTWLRIPVAILLLMLAVAVIYYFAPNVDQEFRFITPGAVLAVIFWVAASLGFSYYVSNFANYSATYGSIGTVIMLLLYFFLSSAVLLFGAEVNAVIEHNAVEGKNSGEKTSDGDAFGTRSPRGAPPGR